MRDQFGIKPKVNTYSYRTPYPPAYDLIPLPNRYKVPYFTKFSRQDDTSTMEHVNASLFNVERQLAEMN
jgi:hypothetical protein